MKIPKCKGATDLLPRDMQRFRYIEDLFRECCARWGYREIRTPTLEYLHLFTSAGTLSPAMLGRVYSFLDWDGWSGERVVLRPDGTIAAARLYVDALSDATTARLFYVENMFSFEGTGQQSRERWQCGVELLGAREPEGDAELIMLGLDILRQLGIAPVKVKLSHVGLLKTLLTEMGLGLEEQSQALSRILTGQAREITKLDTLPAEPRRFLKLLDLQGTSKGFLQNFASLLPAGLSALKPSIDDLARIAELLDNVGQPYEIDFASGEGFEYYTGIVFQFYGASELLGKGGRYDELIPLVGGGAVPASGFAFLVDKAIPLVPEIPELLSRIALTPESAEIRDMKTFFDLADRLRELGCGVELAMNTPPGEDCQWVIGVQEGDELKLSLTDNTTGRKKKGLSIDQVLRKLGGPE